MVFHGTGQKTRTAFGKMRGTGASRPVAQRFVLHTLRVLWVVSVRSDRLRVETPRKIEVVFVLRGSLEFPNEFRVGEIDITTDAEQIVDSSVRVANDPAWFVIDVQHGVL